jgi:hypothetical protein
VAEPTATPPARQSAFGLRARTRRISPSARERGCGVLCIERGEEHPSIKVKRAAGVASAHWQGVLKCGHIWTCPVCSQDLRAKRAERVAGAMGELGGRWQMVTVTLRHREGVPLKRLRDGLARAWRRTRQGGRIQRVWEERVTATVRAAEVTYGANGWHPHIHVLMRTTEWDEDETDELTRKYARAIERELGPDFRPSDARGIVWSTPFDADDGDAERRGAYLAKLGLEVAGVGKHGRAGGMSPWELAERAVSGDERSKSRWWEYFEATRGRRMVELDDRASAAAERAEQAKARLEEPEHVDPPTIIEVKRDDVRALRRLEQRGMLGIMATILEAAEAGGAAAVAEWIAYAREHGRGQDGQGGRDCDVDRRPTFAAGRTVGGERAGPNGGVVPLEACVPGAC